MTRLGRVWRDGEFWIGVVFAALAALGCWRHVLALLLIGTVSLLLVAAMALVQRRCLRGVSYRRSLSTSRAMFGEEVVLELELVNDKFLPLTWLHLEDAVPASVSLRDASLVEDRTDARRYLESVQAMLPFERVRRRLRFDCDHRGRHVFGPATLRSGDPLALRTEQRSLREQHELLVYPKIFELGPPGVVPRMLLGDLRARVLVDDPSRVAGVRDYRVGDPLRYIDWRASARSVDLLVREHETTASVRVAVFVDLAVRRTGPVSADELVEFTIALAASTVTALATAGIPVGLYGSGTAQNRPISHLPSSAPDALGAMLELLAEASPFGPTSFAGVLARHGARLSPATSILVIASDLSEPSLAVIAERRRVAPVSAIWVRSEVAPAESSSFSDRDLVATYVPGWQHESTLELAR